MTRHDSFTGEKKSTMRAMNTHDTWARKAVADLLRKLYRLINQGLKL